MHKTTPPHNKCMCNETTPPHNDTLFNETTPPHNECMFNEMTPPNNERMINILYLNGDLKPIETSGLCELYLGTETFHLS